MSSVPKPAKQHLKSRTHNRQTASLADFAKVTPELSGFIFVSDRSNRLDEDNNLRVDPLAKIAMWGDEFKVSYLVLIEETETLKIVPPLADAIENDRILGLATTILKNATKT